MWEGCTELTGHNVQVTSSSTKKQTVYTEVHIHSVNNNYLYSTFKKQILQGALTKAKAGHSKKVYKQKEDQIKEKLQ